MELGVAAERIVTTGNLKYESPEPKRLPHLEAQIRNLAQERSILVAGSTMPGEEEQVLDAFQRLGGPRRALLILAPRHPERWNAVYEKLCESGMTVLRRSSLPDREPGEVGSTRPLTPTATKGGEKEVCVTQLTVAALMSDPSCDLEVRTNIP